MVYRLRGISSDDRASRHPLTERDDGWMGGIRPTIHTVRGLGRKELQRAAPSVCLVFAGLASVANLLAYGHLHISLSCRASNGSNKTYVNDSRVAFHRSFHSHIVYDVLSVL